MSQILEVFLETGVDSDCCILMTDKWPRAEESSTEDSNIETSEDSEPDDGSSYDQPQKEPITYPPQANIWTSGDMWTRERSARRRFKTAYVVSLAEFIRQAKPVNYEQLRRLLGSNNCSTQEFSTTKLSQIEAELSTRKHTVFRSPSVQPVDLNQIFSVDGVKDLRVYWIRWKDVTIPGSLVLRLY